MTFLEAEGFQQHATMGRIGPSCEVAMGGLTQATPAVECDKGVTHVRARDCEKTLLSKWPAQAVSGESEALREVYNRPATRPMKCFKESRELQESTR